MTKLEAFDAACAHARELIVEGYYPDIDVDLDSISVTAPGCIGKRAKFEFKEASNED